MFKRTKFVVAVVAAISFAFPVASRDADADTVVATVNGTDITLGHLIVMRDALPAQYDNLDDAVLFDGLVDQAVQQLVLAQTIKTPTRAINLRLENERWTLLAGTAMNAEIAKTVTDEALQVTYKEKYANLQPSKEYNASHILVETEDAAKDLVTQLRDGADFAAMAIEHSTGPSGPSGGALGWFGVGMMVAPFEEAVLAMEAGQISDPVQTQFGWHVIILNDTRLIGAPEFDTVRDELAQEMQQTVIEEILAKLGESSVVVRPDLSGIDPAILRDIGLVQD